MATKSFVETFSQFDGHWLPWRAELEHEAARRRMLLRPTAVDGDFYVWTSPAKPRQKADYGLFGYGLGGLAQIQVGLASGSFSAQAGRIHLVIGHNPKLDDEYITLWSKSSIRACDLTPDGVTLSAPLIEAEWQEGVATQAFGGRPNVRFVLENISEFGLSHHHPWNGIDDGVLWFTNATIFHS